LIAPNFKQYPEMCLDWPFYLLKEGACNKQDKQCAYKRNIEARVVTIVEVHMKTYHIF
jgi:hypothetical protein